MRLVTVVPRKECQDPRVSTSLGVIQGTKATDGRYNMFMGIPYGKVPEENPFGAAQPIPKLEGIFEAKDDTALSPQEEEFTKTIMGTLDCLHLNIYVPHSADPVSNLLPVMVWIHGGRYEIGFAGRYVFGPKYFMKQNVILVTINYRLGVYGFVCGNTANVPGNQGIKDVLMGLRWIKKNIKDFGGNYNNVTVFGESSGAVIIDLFLMIDEDLFNKVILMSGVATRPLTIREQDLTIPGQIAARLGHKTENINEAVEFLAKLDPLLVIQACTDLGINFRPCIERKFENVEQVIPDFPINLPIRDLRSMPLMVGYCDAETMYRHYHKSEIEFAENNIFNKYLQCTFDLGKDKKSVEDIVRQFYLGDKKITKDAMWEIINFDSDFSFIYPIRSRIKEYIAHGSGDIYQYLFTYCGGRNFVKKRANINEGGACHADELGYLFDISYETKPSKLDQLVIDRMTTMWSNFAKHGNPIPMTTDLLPVKWFPTTKDLDHCMVIDAELSPITRPFHQRMAFWELFFKIYKKKTRVYRNVIN